MIYYFPDLRGKCAKRTLREIILLADARSAWLPNPSRSGVTLAPSGTCWPIRTADCGHASTRDNLIELLQVDRANIERGFRRAIHPSIREE